jgi:lysophospholipase
MENAPFFEHIAQGPDGGAAHWLTTADGLRIRVGHWTGEDVQGTVLLFPGRTEYIEKYGPTAAHLLAQGFATLVIDWRGQGLSDRTSDTYAMGDVVSFTDYQHDVTAAVDHARALGLPEPFCLIAHSMGGCIGLRALHNGLEVKAAAFSAPMWGLMLSTVMRPIAWVASTVARKVGLEAKFASGQKPSSYVTRAEFEGNTLTSDKAMFEFMQMQLREEPRLALGGASFRWLNEALHEMRALSQLTSPNLPCCTFLGTLEAIVDPQRIRDRMGHWTAGALHVVDGGQHEVMLETPERRAQMLDTTTAFFNQHP